MWVVPLGKYFRKCEKTLFTAAREKQSKLEQRQVCEGLSSVRGTHVGAGEECEKEGAAEKKSNGLMVILTLPLPVLLRERR